MKRISQRGMYNAMADINIVPMMDLVFNLLIVFMLATPLLENAIPLNLAKASSATPVDSKDVLIVSLDSKGTIFLDKKAVSLRELEDFMRARAKMNPQQAVAVRGDTQVSYGKFVEIVDCLKLAGITKFGIMGKVE